jgi:hypothetical protein
MTPSTASSLPSTPSSSPTRSDAGWPQCARWPG